MRKQGKFVISGVVIVFLVFTALLVFLQSERSQHQRLLDGLSLSSVEYISIYASYGNQEAVLSEDDTAEVLRQLSEASLTGSGTQDYGLQFSLRHPMFHIKLKSGIEFDFAAWKPYFIINTENFGEKYGRSMENGGAATGSGYEIRPTLYHACTQLRMTYDDLCRVYFPR